MLETEQKSIIIKNARGFTLIELLVVIAIIAITSTISLFVVSAQLPIMRLNNAVSTIRGQFNSARAQALKRDNSVILVLNPANRTITVWSDENDTGVQDGAIIVGTNPVTGGPNYVADERIVSYTLPTSVQFGFGNPPQANAPTNSPTAGLGVSNPCEFVTGTNHLYNGEYHFTFNKSGRFVDRNKKLSHGIIYISNPVGTFAALEILAGGAIIPWRYNIDGGNTWKQK